ncbi:hypothetical protein UB44_22755 [Burkholderiaceae bacterium 26]|nr:hypothetical protein UB44_22755 [Burkholderiaceae bacterium 26]
MELTAWWQATRTELTRKVEKRCTKTIALTVPPLAQILMGVLAVTVFAAVMFDVMNADGYLGAWYTDVTGYKWPWSGRCLLLPCSHR